MTFKKSATNCAVFTSVVVLLAGCGDDNGNPQPTGGAAPETTSGEPAPTVGSVPDTATATTDVISPHGHCWDEILSEDPAVHVDYQFYTNDEILLAPPATSGNHQTTSYALFITDNEDGTAIAGIKFTISRQDVITVIEARDSECDELAWEFAGNTQTTSDDGHLRTNSALANLEIDETTYEIELAAIENIILPGGQILRTDYQASVRAATE